MTDLKEDGVGMIIIITSGVGRGIAKEVCSSTGAPGVHGTHRYDLSTKKTREKRRASVAGLINHSTSSALNPT